MTLRACLMIVAVCLTLVGCNNRPPGDSNPEPVVAYHVTPVAYDTLKGGGGLYLGTVVSVTVKERELDFDAEIERGELQFEVTQTLAGGPRQKISIPFWWRDKQGVRRGAAADWIGASVWPDRPKPAERLLLLIGNEERARLKKADFPLLHRWVIGHDNALVEGFEMAVRFLDAKDKAVREGLYRQLCESPQENMRVFACDAAFAYLGQFAAKPPGYIRYAGDGWDPIEQSHLALLYMKHAVPKISIEERLGVTGSFALWFSSSVVGVTEELKAAFEDWYMEELSIRQDMRRVKAALEGLEEIQEDNKAVDIIGLFKNVGRAGLIATLQKCVDTGDPEIRKLGRELLTSLDKPDGK